MEFTHDILVSGPDFEACEQRVRRFFAKTMLVRYDEVRISRVESITVQEPAFWQRVDEGVAANRRVVKDLFEEMAREGLRTINDLRNMDQGYSSKLFHIIAHLLDGFFGIDTVLYNLEEDSHWISEQLREEIAADPAAYRLLKVTAETRHGDADQLQKLRSFEGKSS